MLRVMWDANWLGIGIVELCISTYELDAYSAQGVGIEALVGSERPIRCDEW